MGKAKDSKRIATGIRLVCDKYEVSIDITPKKNENVNIHLGTFDTFERAKEIRDEAEKLRDTLTGDKLLKAMNKIKDGNKIYSVKCCGEKMLKKWKYCPFCGRSIKAGRANRTTKAAK